MNIKPLGNRLVVKLVKQKTTTASGIIISSKEENEKAKGEVISIGGGQGKDNNITELGLKVGDIVLFGNYAGDEINSDPTSDDVYKILEGKDIIATIK
ncbi:co-chaperone GroES [Candidatus Gracilibacteria bacterium]|nr:co-chaperone GroES [Thermales bacterium]NJL96998.1 co-chaperone GroES [Candidatus Gracilibacteria bacterium]NJS41618.1 co-chaperone GroES [Candidatus Gracilibacteria bacterium]